MERASRKRTSKINTRRKGILKLLLRRVLQKTSMTAYMYKRLARSDPRQALHWPQATPTSQRETPPDYFATRMLRWTPGRMSRYLRAQVAARISLSDWHQGIYIRPLPIRVPIPGDTAHSPRQQLRDRARKTIHALIRGYSPGIPMQRPPSDRHRHQDTPATLTKTAAGTKTITASPKANRALAHRRNILTSPDKSLPSVALR